MTRPDSTFFLKPASTEASWIMSFAAAKNGKGEPDDCTQKTFVFRGGKAIRLHAFTYHTVPIPLQDQESVIFSEVIAATNANIVIDVLAETGHPIQFSHGV
jgi:ureidoglycolate hydrolase